MDRGLVGRVGQRWLRVGETGTGYSRRGGQGVDRGLVGRVIQRWLKRVGGRVGWEAKEWTGAWSDGSISVG